MLYGNPQNFVSPDDNFLAEYALFDKSGEVLESNVEGKRIGNIGYLFKKNTNNIHISQYTYSDGSTIVIFGITEESL